MPPRLVFEDVKRIFEAAKCILVSKEYKTNKKPLEYLCSCGNTEVHTTRLDIFNRGIRCKNCRQERMKATNMERFGYEYISQDPAKKQAVLKGMLKHIEDKKHTINDLKVIFKKAGCTLLETNYIDNKLRMRFKCVCGKEGKISFNKFNKGQRCSDNDCMELRKKHTNLDKFGTEYATQSVEVQERIEKSGFKHKTYTFPSGKQVKIQGYENYALDYILLSFDEDDIHVGRGQQPEIWYNTDDGKKHRYFSDIFIPSENLIIEVKSTWTYKKGVFRDNIKQKEAACIAKGYQYQYLIFDDKGILQTPD